MKQRFTLDQQAFEQFLAAASLVQPLQRAVATRSGGEKNSLLVDLLETLRGTDSGTLALQAGLDRVAQLALHIVGGSGAVLWVFKPEGLVGRSVAGSDLQDDYLLSALQSKLQSADAFGVNPPARLDLTALFGNYPRPAGSCLAVAVLPGKGTAGALAVFSLEPRTFAGKDYANLRLLAGLAQYILMNQCEPKPSPDDLPNELAERRPYKLDALPSISRSARGPLVMQGPVSGPPHPTPETVHSPFVIAPAVTSDETGYEESASKYPLATVQWRKLFSTEKLRELLLASQATGANAVQSALSRTGAFRLNWPAVQQAAPAVVILAVMSFFVGLSIGGRQPLPSSSLNATAQAAMLPVAAKPVAAVNLPVAAVLAASKPPTPADTSHLRITDHHSAATIADMTKYEIRNLPRAAAYGDDDAALQLGMLYEMGRGFPQNCKKAAEWVTKAAQYGNAVAEYNLGLRYRDGDGVATDLKQAEYWLKKAAANKNSDAVRTLAQLQLPQS
jgi:hypothetical protein